MKKVPQDDNNLCMCVYVCYMYVCTVYTQIHTHAYLHVRIMHTCIHACMHAYIHTYIHTFLKGALCCALVIPFYQKTRLESYVIRHASCHMRSELVTSCVGMQSLHNRVPCSSVVFRVREMCGSGTTRIE